MKTTNFFAIWMQTASSASRTGLSLAKFVVTKLPDSEPRSRALTREKSVPRELVLILSFFNEF